MQIVGFRGIHGEKKIKGRILTLLLAVLLFLSAASCSRGSPQPTDPAVTLPPLETEPPAGNGGTAGKTRGLPGTRTERMTVGLEDASLFNKNPFGEGLFPVDASGLFTLVYETLFFYDPSALAYKPLLADSVIFEEGGLTLKLDGGRAWHDGYPVTSRDLLFSIEAHRQFGTAAGLVFRELITDLTALEDTVLEILYDNGQEGALARLFDAFSKALILPRHIWEPLTTDGLPLEESALPLIGSGAWAFLQEDDFSISFERAVPGTDGQPSYLTILKYEAAGYAQRALVNQDIDWLIPAFKPDLPEGLEEVPSGEILAGIGVNPRAGDWLTRPAVRQLLGLAADIETTGSLLFPSGLPISAADLLTLPSAMGQLDRQKLEGALLIPDADTIGRLQESAGLTKNPDTGLLENLDGQPLPALILLYPQDAEEAEASLKAFSSSAKKLGFSIILRGVPEELWREYSELGRYDLIYQETRPNETPAELADRLLKLLPQEEEEGRGLILRMEEVNASRTERIRSMENLTLWLMDEALFIPLGAGRVHAGIRNNALIPDFDFSTLLPSFIS